MKKGDQVWLIRSWDDKGAFYFQPFVVHSAGTKQVHLVSDDGEFLHERLYRSTDASALWAADNCIFPRSIDPVAKSLELASAFIAAQLAYWQENVGRDAYYQPSVLKNVAHFEAVQPTAYSCEETRAITQAKRG